MEKPREFGEIPHWAKTGPITLRNYGYRAEVHCKSKSQERNGAHPTIKIGTDDFRAWRQYFERHLGGLPVVMERMLQNPNDDRREMTVPELVPQWFDPSFVPDQKWREREYIQLGARPVAREPIPSGRDYVSMVAKHGIPRAPNEPGPDGRPMPPPYRGPPFVPYTDEQLRKLYGIHPSFVSEPAE